ncbi:MAG: transcriptional regulator [Candidatus Aminicenantes bacterium]|nr:transcriptional regulator [Candidatus Aminicenantes bacterium]
MIDLIRVLGSEHAFEIIDFLKKNPDQNASFIASNLNIHIVTVQRVLETMEKYGFVSTKEKGGVGRPSKTFSYIGGDFKVNLDDLFSGYDLKDKLVRETGSSDVTFSYNVDKEFVNAILVGGKRGKKIKLDPKTGRFLWLVPPPDSKGETIESISSQAGLPLPDAIKFCLDMQDLEILEVIR